MTAIRPGYPEVSTATMARPVHCRRPGWAVVAVGHDDGAAADDDAVDRDVGWLRRRGWAVDPRVRTDGRPIFAPWRTSIWAPKAMRP